MVPNESQDSLDVELCPPAQDSVLGREPLWLLVQNVNKQPPGGCWYKPTERDLVLISIVVGDRRSVFVALGVVKCSGIYWMDGCFF